MNNDVDASDVNGMTWLYGMWFCGDGKTGDFFATLGTRDGKATMEYRFRYYNDNKAHGSKDRKSYLPGEGRLARGLPSHEGHHRYP
jgi:hypothetical protein